LIRDLNRLEAEEFDVVIIGGGIHGAAVAWDAALRGLSVALIEKSDFGSQTTAGSYRILHGGLRYLQHLDFKRMRNSISERSIMMRIAPNLSKPLGFVVPVQKGISKGPLAMNVALHINDLFACDRNNLIKDVSKQLPRSRMLTKKQFEKQWPALAREEISGAGIFYDAMLLSSERLCLHFVLSAWKKGACCCNHVAACRLIVEKGRTTGVEAEDALTGRTIRIHAKVTVNASGPWTHLLMAREPLEERVYSSGIQLATSCLLETHGCGIAFPGVRRDYEAHLSRGNRHYFVVPWRNQLIWGTTDEPWKGNPSNWRITEESIENFMREINQAIPSLAMKRSDILYAFGGLRPSEASSSGENITATRHEKLIDHERTGGPGNLLTIEAVKLTTARLTAEKIVNLIYSKLGRASEPCSTENHPLIGGDFPDLHDLHQNLKKASPPDLSDEDLLSAIELYGNETSKLFAYWTSEHHGKESYRLRYAQARHALANEGAVIIEDVVRRMCPSTPELGKQWESIAIQALSDYTSSHDSRGGP